MAARRTPRCARSASAFIAVRANTRSSGVPHRVTEDDVYEGYRIPKGSIVIPNIWKMTHDAETYADPMAFTPERFLTHATRAAERDPKELVFGFGRRCVPPSPFHMPSALTRACAQGVPGLAPGGHVRVARVRDGTRRVRRAQGARAGRARGDARAGDGERDDLASAPVPVRDHAAIGARGGARHGGRVCERVSGGGLASRGVDVRSLFLFSFMFRLSALLVLVIFVTPLTSHSA